MNAPAPPPAGRRALWAGLVVTLVLHLVLLWWLLLPRPVVLDTPVTVELQLRPWQPLPAIHPASAAPARPRPAPPRAPPPPDLAAAARVAPPLSDLAPLVAATEPGEADLTPRLGDALAHLDVAGVLPSLSGEPVVVVGENPGLPGGQGVAPAGVALPAALPREGEVDYQVSLGQGDGWQVARGTLHWRLDPQRYHIDLTARTVGIARLLKSDPVSQISEGRVTAAGLVPDQFRVLGRISAQAEEDAQFDWNAHQLTFLPAGTGVPLPDGTQDLLSFFLQFAMQPPTVEGLEHPVTNGRKLDRLAFELTDRSTLQLPLGTFSTVHISKLHAASEDDFDVWLAQDRHYLPVQIRFRARGRLLTLSATAIRVPSPTGAL